MADESVIHVVPQPSVTSDTSPTTVAATPSPAVAATPSPAVAASSPATPPPVIITVRPNGPLRIEGHIILKDADGMEWDLTGKPAISLCRCGLSEKRPFCDGTHSRQGWQCQASPGNMTGK